MAVVPVDPVEPVEGDDGDFLLRPPGPPAPPRPVGDPPRHVGNAVSGSVAGPVVQAGVIQSVTVNYQAGDGSSRPEQPRPATTPPALGAQVPRTAEDIAETRRSRPNLWEHLLYAGELHVGWTALEAKRLDHALGHRTNGPLIRDEAEAMSHLDAAVQELRQISASVGRWLSPDAQLRALGPPGAPGDAALIAHIVQRLLSTYESLIDWAVALRSARPPARLVKLFEVTSRLSEGSIHAFDSFVETLVRQTDEASALLARQDGSTAVITVTYTMTISPDVLDEIDRESRRVTVAANRPRKQRRS
ncbi:hypothetical protein OK074_4286 [Actinobacteria bacterium OK074]|nr:hypothetical protein OK074_4286 [Actinobacteria bacterium OK074]